MKVLFFGQITKRGRLRGEVTPSTTVRCINLKHELEKSGVLCSVRYRTSREFRDSLKAVRDNDIIVFHRLQFPMASRPEPPTELFLHSASRTAGKVTAFDLDDAIFLDHPLLTEYFVAKSDLVTVGSHQLMSFALKWNKHVHLLPSSVNTEAFHPSIRQQRKEHAACILGWHGTAYVQSKNLHILVPALKKLVRRYDLWLKLLGTMGDKRIQKLFNGIAGLRVEYGPNKWIPYEQLPSVIADVDIGLSPLRDSLWSRSKCAMKALEYMSMGVPVVASPVGEHNYLIRDGVNGFLASSEEEWVQKISNLVEDRAHSDQVGQRARETVLKGYSLSVVAKRFADIVSGG